MKLRIIRNATVLVADDAPDCVEAYVVNRAIVPVWPMGNASPVMDHQPAIEKAIAEGHDEVEVQSA